MWDWMFLHLVCDSKFLSSGYQGRSACRWAALPNPGCLSGPNLRKSLWYSNPAKTWHTHTHLRLRGNSLYQCILMGLTFLIWGWQMLHLWPWCSRRALSQVCCSSGHAWPWFYRYFALEDTRKSKAYFTLCFNYASDGARRRRARYLAQTFVSARRSSAPSALCALCPKGRGRSAAPGRPDQTLGSGQNSPRPTAINFTQAQAWVTWSIWPSVMTV